MAPASIRRANWNLLVSVSKPAIGMRGAARQLGAALDVLRLGRLLEPADAAAARTHRHRPSRLGIERGRRIAHEFAVGADRLARRGDPRDSSSKRHAQRRLVQRAGMDRRCDVADLHLVGADSPRCRALATSRARSSTAVVAAVIAGRGVGLQRPAEAAEQPPHRHGRPPCRGCPRARCRCRRDRRAGCPCGRDSRSADRPSPRCIPAAADPRPMTAARSRARCTATLVAHGPPHIAASPQPKRPGSSVWTFTSRASRSSYSPRA